MESHFGPVWYQWLYRIAPKIIEMLKPYHDDNVGTQSALIIYMLKTLYILKLHGCLSGGAIDCYAACCRFDLPTGKIYVCVSSFYVRKSK